MTDDREPFREARAAGKAASQRRRLAIADLSTVRQAIEMLPATCKYHGSKLERDRSTYWHGDEACCDTGKPALARREAEEALKRLEA